MIDVAIKGVSVNVCSYEAVHVEVSPVVPDSLRVHLHCKGVLSDVEVGHSMATLIPPTANVSANQTKPKVLCVITTLAF